MIEGLREALRDEEIRSISRRYFISNGFDGTLTATGITVGSYLSGVSSGLTVFKLATGAMIGLSTSALWSVWEIEKAEKLSDLHEIESALLTDLEGTEVEQRKMEGRVVNAAMSGLGPIVSMLLLASPFLLEQSFLTIFQATVVSVLLGVGLLFGFGAYMGRLSDRNWYVAGARMGLAGLVVAALNFLLPG